MHIPHVFLCCACRVSICVCVSCVRVSCLCVFTRSLGWTLSYDRFAQFSRSLFEVLDQWSDSVDVSSYVALGQALLPVSKR